MYEHASSCIYLFNQLNYHKHINVRACHSCIYLFNQLNYFWWQTYKCMSMLLMHLFVQPTKLLGKHINVWACRSCIYLFNQLTTSWQTYKCMSMPFHLFVQPTKSLWQTYKCTLLLMHLFVQPTKLPCRYKCMSISVSCIYLFNHNYL
jgi:hypothetical protein